MTKELSHVRSAWPTASRPRRLVTVALGTALAVQLSIALARAADAPESAIAISKALRVGPAATSPLNGLVARLSGGRAKIVRTFSAPMGLIGLVVSGGPGRTAVLYASPNGLYLINGQIYGADGQNYTRAAQQLYLPPPPTPAQNFAALKETHSFLWGKKSATKELWMIFDPDCIFCHKSYESLKVLVGEGKLKVHIIAVGFLKPDAMGKSAAIVGASSPSAALASDEDKYDVAAEEGGAIADFRNAKALRWVQGNTAWMKAHGITGTPYMLWRDPSGRVRAEAGYESDVAALMARIGTSAQLR